MGHHSASKIDSVFSVRSTVASARFGVEAGDALVVAPAHSGLAAQPYLFEDGTVRFPPLDMTGIVGRVLSSGRDFPLRETVTSGRSARMRALRA